MTATPVWSINTLDRSLPDGTVTTIHWTVSLTEDDGLSANSYGTLGLPPADPDAFTPYDSLSQELVLEWLHVVMGQELVSAYEASLAQQIDEQRNPKRATGLPWASAPSSNDAAEPLSTDADESLSSDAAEPLSDAA